MRRKFALMLAALCIMAFVSCNAETNDNSGQTAQQDNFIYSNSSDISIVYDASVVSTNGLEELRSVLTEKLDGGQVSFVSPDVKSSHEIVIGRSDRAITKTAYKYLERMDKEAENYVGYVIYTDGNSIAIAFDADKHGLYAAQAVAIEYLINSVLKDGRLVLKKGVVNSSSFDAIEWLEAIDDKEVEKQWEQIETGLLSRTSSENAKAIVTALKNFNNIQNDDVVSWIANLYDPVTGGFYYSNSARNTNGFLPDLESTYQLLRLPVSLGMTDGKSVAEFYPESISNAIVTWVKGLQDPDNGYFYHPQWGKDYTDKLLSKRGRDLQWAEGLLNIFGASPTYDTPNGVKGDGILANGESVVAPASTLLTSRLAKNKVLSVSKLILVNDPDANVPEHLKNKKNFEDYLKTLDIKNNSYTVGNTLESQATQIVARDKVLAERGENYRLADILHKWLNDNQNQETGCWLANGSVNGDAVNGLLKISATYNKIEKEIPNVLVALGTSINYVTSDEEPVHICYVLNPLYAISELKSNIRKFSGDSAEAAIKEADDYIFENAVPFIETVTKKLAIFVKPDGSFSYYPKQTSAESQGATVALVNINEGDANSTNIGAAAIPGHLYSALGIGIRPTTCTKADGYRFIEILEDLGAIIKDVADDERDTAAGKYVQKYGGEYYPERLKIQQLVSLYRASSYIACNDEKMTNAEQERVEITYDDMRNTGILKYGKSTKPSTHGFAIKRTGAEAAGNCFVFETEIKLNELDNEAMAAILEQKQPILLEFTAGEFLSSTSAKVVTANWTGSLGVIYLEKQSDGYYTYFSHASKAYQYISYGTNEYKGKKISADEWFTVTVELYDNGIAKYYINNQYFEEAKIFDSTSSFFTRLDIVKINLANKAVNSSIFVDNTFVGTVQKDYEEGEGMRYYDDIGPGNYGVSYGGLDFDVETAQALMQEGYITRATWSTVVGEGLSYSDTSFIREFLRISEVVRNEKAEKVLEFGARTTNASGIYLRETNPGVGNCFVFESEFMLDIDETTATQIVKNGAAPIFHFHLGKSDAGVSVPATDPNYTGSELARIYVNKDSAGNLRYYVNAPVAKGYMACVSAAEITNGWHTFTMEIYENGIVKYYVDGNILGEAKTVSSQDVTRLSTMNSIKISIEDALDNSYFFLDNTYITRMSKPYLPINPDTGDEGGDEGDAGDIDSPFAGDSDVSDGGWA